MYLKENMKDGAYEDQAEGNTDKIDEWASTTDCISPHEFSE